MKKIAALFLSVLLIVISIPISAGAAEIVDSGDCGYDAAWTLDNEGTLTISGAGITYGHTSYSPAPWRIYSNLIKKVVIEEGITSIGDESFTDCKKMESITIPESVISIGESVFYGCSSLKEITIPKDVTNISDYLFYNCSALTSVTLPADITDIGGHAFSKCSSLTGITIPSGVTSIGDAAFQECSKLTDIVIPNGVTSIGANVFANCTDLKNVTIPASVTSIGKRAFCYCSSLKDITIPDKVTKIGDGAFFECAELKSIIIPDGVTAIGGDTFYNCGSLATVTIPDGITSIGDSAFGYCDDLTGITIPDGVKSIGDGAFANCIGLTSVTIPGSVLGIGEYAFGNCTGLTSLTIFDGVTNFDDYAFGFCSSLEGVTIPASVTSIGDCAFWACEKLTITGYKDSCAYTYAKENDIPFVIIHTFTRLAGTSRVDTSLEIAKEGWESAETVILTNGYNFADALAGGPLAYALDAPIILTANKDELEPNILAQIEALGADKVIILGGALAVNENIEHTLKSLYRVDRIAGQSRFETAVAIADKLADFNGEYSKKAFVAYSHNYPDALAVSSAAAISGTPILFARADGSTDATTELYIKRSHTEEVTLLGGYLAINEAAEENFARFGAKKVKRIFGTSRYDTAFGIVKEYSSLFTGSDIVLATGQEFPDALAGGTFAAKIKAPVILVHPTQIPYGALEYIAEKDPYAVYVLGGEGAVADSTVQTFLSKIE